MIGFITIVKYINTEFEVNDGFDIEQLIMLKRQNNMQFMEMGEPPTKFVYFDSELKEYNVIFLYLNPNLVASQFLDYIRASGHDSFPEQFATSKYGPAKDFEVWIKTVDVPDTLVTRMRACLEAGWQNWNGGDVSFESAEDIDKWASENDVDSIWTKVPDNFDGENKAKDWEAWLDETRGMALNVETKEINEQKPVGVELIEGDLKAVINEAKKGSFPVEVINALEAAGVSVDVTRL